MWGEYLWLKIETSGGFFKQGNKTFWSVKRTFNFPKIWQPPQNSRRLPAEMKQIPYRRPTYIRRHHTEFSRPEFVYRCVTPLPSTPNFCSFVFYYLTNSACSKACLCKKQMGLCFEMGRNMKWTKNFAGEAARKTDIYFIDMHVWEKY